MNEATPVEHAYDGAPVFYILGYDRPRTGALINGGLLSIVVFALISLLIGLGGNRPGRIVGSHHPSRSHLLAAKTATESVDLPAEIKVKPYSDPIPISPYFKLLPVLQALDIDQDNEISASEMKQASASLRKLDKNYDGKLSAEECGLNFGRPSDTNSGVTPELLKRATRQFMRIHPVHAALDSDGDGVISSSEIKNAPAALKTLDENRDGVLTLKELLPDQINVRVSQLITALDENGDGVLSTGELAQTPDLKVRELLKRADRDHDGVVTEQELSDLLWSDALRHPEGTLGNR